MAGEGIHSLGGGPPKRAVINGQEHFLAYITAKEAELLRLCGGGKDKNGKQVMFKGVPAFEGGDGDGGSGNYPSGYAPGDGPAGEKVGAEEEAKPNALKPTTINFVPARQVYGPQATPQIVMAMPSGGGLGGGGVGPTFSQWLSGPTYDPRTGGRGKRPGIAGLMR